MKKIAGCLFLFCLLAACAARQPGPPLVVIADPALAAVLSEAARTPVGQLTPQALGRLTRLDASGRGIKSLAGIEHCSELYDLNLSHNDLTDIGPLAALRGLVLLDLSYNRISDLSPLSSLYRLTEINLASNQVVDIGPLARNRDGGGMPEQTWIHLEDNPLSQTAVEVDIPYLVDEGATITDSNWVLRPKEDEPDFAEPIRPHLYFPPH